MMLSLMRFGTPDAAAGQDQAVLEALGLSAVADTAADLTGTATPGGERSSWQEVALGGVLQYRALASRPGGQDGTGYASMATLRLTAEADYGTLRWVAHMNVEDWRASRPSLLASMVDGQGRTDRIRGLALRERHAGSLQAIGMDWLYAQASLSRARITVGRQPISLTLSRLWSPADIHAPFLPGDLERLYKAGVDAVRLDYYLSDRLSTLSVVSVDREHREGSGGGVQAKWLQRIEYSGERSKSFAYVGQRRHCDLLAAGYLVTGVVGADWYGEALAYRGRAAGADNCSANGGGMRGGWGHRAVVGASVKLAANTIGTLEYFHQTPLSRQADLPWIGSGRQYLGASASYQAHPLVHLDGLWFVNLTDQGQQLTLAMRYTPQRNVVLRASVAGPLTGTGRRGGVASEYWQAGRIVQLGLDWYF
ncbi:hypothetical protein BKK81_22670 [Cupriavidus sp. USMAHM13]|uniref:hypothetical protein n=1 Tax=Cupriavidus sp. USMAHM13 TaxID=1389192 RepID=UPI0008A69DB8|nr:hypothetical protein [Cupriavidus sp. USMAHM13]AOZ02120.1 hypothetical protein BKK81_22670 [Cupriavidus sp. USMAHM13]